MIQDYIKTIRFENPMFVLPHNGICCCSICGMPMTTTQVENHSNTCKEIIKNNRESIKDISEWLDILHIPYIREFPFKNLEQDESKTRILPKTLEDTIKSNVKMCWRADILAFAYGRLFIVEYDGPQHESTKVRDKMRDDYFIQYNIPTLRLSRYSMKNMRMIVSNFIAGLTMWSGQDMELITKELLIPAMELYLSKIDAITRFEKIDGIDEYREFLQWFYRQMILHHKFDLRYYINYDEQFGYFNAIMDIRDRLNNGDDIKTILDDLVETRKNIK